MLYTCQITLDNIEPKIWRRFRIHRDITFHQLHQILQNVMGWENHHLYEFELEGKSILLPDPDFPPENRIELNSRREVVAKYFSKQGQTIRYTYDMGDNWRHTITLEQIEQMKKLGALPVCLDGNRACPQEDSGGTWGHQNVLEAMLIKEHPEKQEMLQWLKEGYNPEYYDLKSANDLLKQKGEKLIPTTYRTPLEDKKPVKLTKATLRKQLRSKSVEELSELVVQCFEASKEVERYLTITLLGDEVVESIYLEYRKKVQEVFFPTRGRGSMQLQIAKNEIAQFMRVTGNGKYTASLKLFFVEMGIEFSNTYGDINAEFYNGLAKMYEDVIILINSDESSEWWEELEERVSAVVESTDGYGWGFHDDIKHSYSYLRWI